MTQPLPTRPLLPLSLIAVLCTATCGPCSNPSTPNPPTSTSKPSSEKPTKEDLKSDFVKETEPNDTKDTASAFRLISRSPGSPLLKPFEGELSSASDVDTVAIPASQTPNALRTVTLSTVSDNASDLAIQWGDNPAQLQNAAPAGQPEVIPNLSAQPVWIAVRPGPNATFPLRYRLELSNNPSPSSSLHPESSEPQPPHVLPVPGDLQGLINYRNDEDTFTLSSSQTPHHDVRIELRPSPKPIPLSISLRDASDTPIWSAQTHPDSPQDPLVFPALRLTPSTSYTLTVRSPASSDTPLDGSPSAYTLRVLPMPPPPKGTTTDVEPSHEDSPIPASLSRKRATLSGTLAGRSDRDAFLLQTPKSSTQDTWLVTAQLQGDAVDMGLMMRFDDPSQPDQPKRTDAAGSPPDQLESICLQPVPSDTPVLFAVYAENPRQDGPDPSGAYTLSVAFRQPAEGEEREPNSQPGQESPISLGSTAQGTLYPARDVDLFLLTLGAPSSKPRVVIPDPRKTPTPTPSPEGSERSDRPTSAPSKKGGISSVLDRLVGNREDDPDTEPNPDSPGPSEDPLTPIEIVWSARASDASLELLDEDGVVVARSDQPGEGRTETLRVSLPKGVYTIRVAHKGDSALCDDPYRLSVRSLKTEPTPRP